MVEARLHHNPSDVPRERIFPALRRPGLRAAMSDFRLCLVAYGVLAAVPFAWPEFWAAAMLAAAAYSLFLASLRFRCPMRVPASWTGPDYGDRKDGSDTDFKKASGILYLGTDREGGELWISNSDARRHIFALGTTGSGKTEFLLGLLVQPMMWGSGALFVDGKGTPEFYARVYSLAKRFGREDDVRLVNFTGVEAGTDPDAPAGSIGSQSNTLNPFARGTHDQLTNMVSSLMGGGGDSGGNQMWRDRSVQLVSTLIRALVEMRDKGEILLDVQTIRSYMPLGDGVPGGCGKDLQPHEIQQAEESAKDLNIAAEHAAMLRRIKTEKWTAIKRDTSVTALYLRALNGDFSNAVRLALHGYFDSLPGFDKKKMFEGERQAEKTQEQHGYLTMQLTKPLGSMADDFGHIFRTPLAEVDMDDIIYNRRILVVLLPALQKASEETRNLGRIIVAMAKSMMGAASGSRVVGSRREIVETAPTRSNSPFIAVFDEAGYYLVKGLDVMAAQARALGFSIVIGAQDIQAMRGEVAQTADSVIANTFLNVYGATVDADATLRFIQEKTGRGYAALTAGAERLGGLLSSRTRDRGDVQYQEVQRVTGDELRSLEPGEFAFVFQDRIHRGRGFYVGSDIAPHIAINTFLPVKGPLDRVPGAAAVEEDEWRTARDRVLTAGVPQKRMSATKTTNGLVHAAARNIDVDPCVLGGGFAGRVAAVMCHHLDFGAEKSPADGGGAAQPPAAADADRRAAPAADADPSAMVPSFPGELG